jgi:tRNA A-37 threonylcarbamoyl transferase component Bud32
VGTSRPFRELWLTDQALKKGIATAEIVAACHTEVFWWFHRGHLISKEITNGRDLMSYLKRLQGSLPAEKIAEKRNVIVAVAKAIRKMHDTGIFHADLNLKNIVIQIDEVAGIRSYLIDFDKSVMKQRLSERRRRQNLMRLNRSVEKAKRQGLPLTRTDSLRFIRAYYQEETGTLGDIVRDLNKQYGRHIYLHRLGKKMLNLFT